MSVQIYVSLVRRRGETPTPHYTNTCVKLTIVTHLSFSERIAIANLSQMVVFLPWLLVYTMGPTVRRNRARVDQPDTTAFERARVLAISKEALK